MSNVTVKKVAPSEKWVILGDTQVPYHDPRAVELATTLIKVIQPTDIVYNGDMIDFWGISKHQPSRHEVLKSLSIQEEIDMTIAIEDKLASGAPDAKKHQIDGNHENRWEKFLGTGPQAVLGGLRDLQMHNVFKYAERGFSSYHPYGEGIFITPDLFVYHGEMVGGLPGDSVKKEIVGIGASVIMNHVHRRADLLFRRGKDEHRGIENGCLCQLQSAYKSMTNWAHCITVVEVYGNVAVPTVIDMVHTEDMIYSIYKDKMYSVPLDYHDGMALSWRPHQNIKFKD